VMTSSVPSSPETRPRKDFVLIIFIFVTII
jgi:hypothetical protein